MVGVCFNGVSPLLYPQTQYHSELCLWLLTVSRWHLSTYRARCCMLLFLSSFIPLWRLWKWHPMGDIFLSPPHCFIFPRPIYIRPCQNFKLPILHNTQHSLVFVRQPFLTAYPCRQFKALHISSLIFIKPNCCVIVVFKASDILYQVSLSHVMKCAVCFGLNSHSS